MTVLRFGEVQLPLLCIIFIVSQSTAVVCKCFEKEPFQPLESTGSDMFCFFYGLTQYVNSRQVPSISFTPLLSQNIGFEENA